MFVDVRIPYSSRLQTVNTDRVELITHTTYGKCLLWFSDRKEHCVELDMSAEEVRDLFNQNTQMFRRCKVRRNK